MLKKSFLLTISFILSLLTLYAQDRSEITSNETGVWTGLYTKFRLSEKLFYYAETHYRRRNSLSNENDFAGRMFAVYNRHGINYLVNKNFEITAGPVAVRNWAPDPDNPDFESATWQFRIWHQYILIMPQMGRFKIYHQFRFEHRWRRRSFLKTDNKYLFSNRWRYKLFGYIPLNKRVLETGTFFISPSVEIFFQSGKPIVRDPLEDLRIYPTIGYVVNEHIMISAGHMWTMGQEPSGWEYAVRNIVRFNLYINLDFRNPSRIVPDVMMGD